MDNTGDTGPTVTVFVPKPKNDFPLWIVSIIVLIMLCALFLLTYLFLLVKRRLWIQKHAHDVILPVRKVSSQDDSQSTVVEIDVEVPEDRHVPAERHTAETQRGTEQEGVSQPQPERRRRRTHPPQPPPPTTENDPDKQQHDRHDTRRDKETVQKQHAGTNQASSDNHKITEINQARPAPDVYYNIQTDASPAHAQDVYYNDGYAAHLRSVSPRYVRPEGRDDLYRLPDRPTQPAAASQRPTDTDDDVSQAPRGDVREPRPLHTLKDKLLYGLLKFERKRAPHKGHQDAMSQTQPDLDGNADLEVPQTLPELYYNVEQARSLPPPPRRERFQSQASIATNYSGVRDCGPLEEVTYNLDHVTIHDPPRSQRRDARTLPIPQPRLSFHERPKFSTRIHIDPRGARISGCDVTDRAFTYGISEDIDRPPALPVRRGHVSSDRPEAKPRKHVGSKVGALIGSLGASLSDIYTNVPRPDPHRQVASHKNERVVTNSYYYHDNQPIDCEVTDPVASDVEPEEVDREVNDDLYLQPRDTAETRVVMESHGGYPDAPDAKYARNRSEPRDVSSPRDPAYPRDVTSPRGVHPRMERRVTFGSTFDDSSFDESSVSGAVTSQPGVTSLRRGQWLTAPAEYQVLERSLAISV